MEAVNLAVLQHERECLGRSDGPCGVAEKRSGLKGFYGCFDNSSSYCEMLSTSESIATN